MGKRKIVYIDEEKCNGCGECIPNCHEGALQIIDGKARLISDLFCDGLGACIGHCPMDAIRILEREAQPYDEYKVMDIIVKQGENTLKAHLKHLLEHKEYDLYQQALDYLAKKKIPVPVIEQDTAEAIPCGCPGSMVRAVDKKNHSEITYTPANSELTQWPIQLHLVPIHASFFNNAHLLIAASCSAFVLGSFHHDLLHRKKLLIACPKLDNTTPYKEKLIQIFKENELKSITVAMMEVPCCQGLYRLVREALEESGKSVPLIKEIINIQGKLL